MPIIDATGRIWYPYNDQPDPVVGTTNGVVPKIGTGMCRGIQSKSVGYTGLSSDFEIGTQDFTIQSYMYWDDTTFEYDGATYSCNPEWLFTMPSTLEITFGGDLTYGILYLKLFAIATMHEVYSDNFTFAKNVWIHFAVVRHSGVLTFYKDGVGIGGGSLTDYIASPTSDYVNFPGQTPI